MSKYKTKLTDIQKYDTGATRDNSQGKGRFDLIPDIALERVAKVYERGAINHGERNWEQGVPFSRLIDSAIRHLVQWKMSKYRKRLEEEDHLGHAIWNIMAIIYEEEMIEDGCLPAELDNMPKYASKLEAILEENTKED